MEERSQERIWECTMAYRRDLPMKPYKDDSKLWYCRDCIKAINKASKYNHVKTTSHMNMIEK